MRLDADPLATVIDAASADVAVGADTARKAEAIAIATRKAKPERRPLADAAGLVNGGGRARAALGGIARRARSVPRLRRDLAQIPRRRPGGGWRQARGDRCCPPHCPTAACWSMLGGG